MYSIFNVFTKLRMIFTIASQNRKNETITFTNTLMLNVQHSKDIMNINIVLIQAPSSHVCFFIEVSGN